MASQPQRIDGSRYEYQQDKMDREYDAEWAKAPKSFLKKAAALGIKPHTEKPSRSMPVEEAMETVSYTPDMADTIDTQVDLLIEKYGNEELIRKVVNDLKAPMEMEIVKNRALLLGRVAGFLIKSETSNIQARAHQLLHAIPLLAEINGYKTMRESARACGVSPEWIVRGRNQWCEALGIPIPQTGKKSAGAIAKYRNNAIVNHWRKKKFGAKKLQVAIPVAIKPKANHI